jgi:hypothetical protein
MQAHLHVGRRTLKRQLRTFLIVLSPIPFLFIFGCPARRMSSVTQNGKTYANYDNNTEYEILDGLPAPAIILVPLWWPHKNVANMRWVADVTNKPSADAQPAQ